MGKSIITFYWLLLTLGSVTAQAVRAERALPQWLVGIIAVSGFLFLIFVAFLVNKAWCEKPKGQREEDTVIPNNYATANGSAYETSLNMDKGNDQLSAYENVDIHTADDKVTAM
ncbi:PDZK1-interacting protein 1 [Chanos chanos]|uniref:PDZK1-interacting protein 1 n=1 Tax=Chanos chanos TaxID=29144 RepID=A0A6J2WU96_CHACN|nr:small integral membrane protein 24-like [Chanos chanos]